MTDQQTYTFQTEVKQLLNLVINSLYSNKEVFLRELISNSSDAIEKLRFAGMDQPELLKDAGESHVQIDVDDEAKTVTVRDNGIGMNHDEVIENLGTIANSGTKKFLESLTGDQNKDSALIGQFGVGFYSAFIVADDVTVDTRKAGDKPENGVRWTSSADGQYTVETISKQTPGTEIILHLREGEEEFLQRQRLRSIVKKYSDCLSTPIEMKKVEQDDQGNETVTDEWEVINSAKALWTRAKEEITDEEYKEFYKQLSHDFGEPLTWSHNKVEGNLEYTSLLYIPENKPFDLWDRDRKSGLQLYVQRVFIMENEDLLPPYLRFVKGLIDSNDLPLNVSRELLQNNRVIHKLKKATTKKVLSMLSGLASNHAEDYQKLWNNFGTVLKEGLAEDHDNQAKIAKLARFASTHEDTNVQNVSLDDYIARMKEGQETIYYITAESFNAAKNNPQLEAFRAKGIEVLLLSDRVDEWVMSHFTEYEGKTLKSVLKGDVDLSQFETEEDKKAHEAQEKEYEKIIEQMKEALKNQVEDVRLSKRLTDSPSCVVVNDYGMTLHMQKLMEEAGQMMPGLGGMKPILEINGQHPVIQRLKEEVDDTRFNELSEVLYQQALLTEGAKIDDPARFVKLVNKYIV